MLIAIPVYDKFTALDAVGPYEVLSRLVDAEVVFCGVEAGPVRTDTRSLAVVADRTLADVGQPDVLVVPGGPGSRREIEPLGELVDWVRTVHPGTTWTTSVCTGALILAAAGVLDGLTATTHWGATSELEALGSDVRYVPERFVEHGKIVTAAGVSAGIDMALMLAARIAGQDYAEAIQLGIEYDPSPPFDTGSPAKARPETFAALQSVLRR